MTGAPEEKPRGSRLSSRLQQDAELRAFLQRQVSSEVAQELIRLRRYRGLTQQAVATRLGSTQSVVAKHESGTSNMSLSSLQKLLEALKAVVRIELIPQELGELRSCVPKWWEFAVLTEGNLQLQITYQLTPSVTHADSAIAQPEIPAISEASVDWGWVDVVSPSRSAHVPEGVPA